MPKPTAGTILRMKKVDKPKKKNPSLKNKIRNLERFLKKDSLPDDIRQSKEEELEGLKRQTTDKVKEDKSREITLKFKKVKFFDRRRLMRILKKLNRQLEACDDVNEKEKIEKEFQLAKEQMMYVYFFPKGEEYISLFPDAKKPHPSDVLSRQTDYMKTAIESFKKLKSQTAFDHYCFNDENTAKELPEPIEKGKRKSTDRDSKKRKDKRRKTDAKVVADMEGDKNESTGDDDFFM